MMSNNRITPGKAENLDDVLSSLGDCPVDRYVVALVRKDERYIFVYTQENSAKILRTLGRFASNQELSFTWHDAAVLSRRVREEV